MALKSKIVAFPGSRPVRVPLAWFCRLGRTGHEQLATLRASGGSPIDRVVVGSSVRDWQKSLVVDLQRNGTEAVLDTKVAELGSPAKAVGIATEAPRATHADGAPMRPDPELQAIPDAHRASHFVGQTLAKAARHARDVTALDLKASQADTFGVANPERLTKSLMRHASTLDRKQRVREDLLGSTDGAGRAVPIVARRKEVERGSSFAGGKGR